MPNWKKVITSGSDASLNTLTVVNGITGSLFGTASYALTAGNGGVTKIIAGANIGLSPVSGLGDVTISAFNANSYNTATGSYGSFYDTGSVLAASSTAIYSMSLSTTDISNGVFVSASNGDKTRVKFTNAGTYNVQFSSQFSNSDNSTQDTVVWLRKNGTDIPDSSGTVGVPPFKAGSNGQVIASWNYLVNLAANDFIQLCWHAEQANVITLETIAAGTSPTHPRTPSTILTATRVDTFLSNTGSFSGSFTGILTGTASYATQALSSSFATTASYASTYAPVFPYTGSAIISGSLNITGSLNVTDSILQNGGALAVQDGTILYHSLKWFTPSGTVSTSGTTVTSVGAQFTSAMVGSKLTINGESRIITVYNATTIVTVASAYSQNYSAIAAGSWGVYSKVIEITPNQYSYFSIYDSFGVLNTRTDGTQFYIKNFRTLNNNVNILDTGLLLGGSRNLSWTNDTGSVNSVGGTIDTALRRNTAGVLEIYNGITADGLLASRRDLLARNIVATTFTGSLLGTASTASYVVTAQTASYVTLAQTASYVTTAQTASYVLNAVSASYAPPTFPYTGSAIITGSLTVTGTTIAGFNPAPRTGSIRDGVTSVLGDLQDWNSQYYSGEVLYSEVSGEAINFGQLCYRDRFGKWLKAVGNIIGDPAKSMLGICLHTVGAEDTATSILTRGYVETTYTDGGSGGAPLFMDASTAGSITVNSPSAAGNVVRIIGNVFWNSAFQSNSVTIVYFNPDNTWIEL
jgi:hypothetical protein